MDTNNKNDAAKNGVLKWRLALVIMSVTFGSNFQIYVTSVVNNPKEIVLDWINGSLVNKHQTILSDGQLDLVWSFVAAECHIAGAIGSLFISVAAEKLGRRRSLIVLSVINIIGGLACGLSKTAGYFELLMAGRFILGFSMALGFGVASMFITEIPPIKYRGASATMQHIFVGLADFVSLTITLPIFLGTQNLWPLAFAFPIIPGVMEFVVVLLHPESPRYAFLSKDNVEVAKKAIGVYQGKEIITSGLEELLHEKTSRKTNDQSQVSVVDLLRHYRYRKPLIISLIVVLAVQLTAISPVMAYSTDMFLGAGLNTTTAKYATCAVGLTNFIGGLCAIYLVERQGRRPLLLGGLLGSLIFLTIMSIMCGLTEYLPDPSIAISYATIAALLCYQYCTALASSVMWFIASELFTQEARSTAIAITNFTFWTVAGSLVYMYLPLRKAAGVSLSYVPFIICLSILLTYLYFNLPETKNKDIQSIAQSFTRNKHAKFNIEHDESTAETVI